nr:hypothetical protein Iba_chr09eCG12540 [Ipomoea batatas]
MVVTCKAGSLPKEDLRNTLSRGNAQAPSGESMQPSQQRAELRAITQLASQLALPVGQPLTHEEERPRMTVTVAEAVGRLLEALGQNPVVDVVPDRVDPATKARGQSTGRGRPRHGVLKSGLPCRPEPSWTQADRQGSHNRQSVFDRLSPENTATSAPRHARHNPRRRHEEAMRRLKGETDWRGHLVSNLVGLEHTVLYPYMKYVKLAILMLLHSRLCRLSTIYYVFPTMRNIVDITDDLGIPRRSVQRYKGK